ncbi:hypothetical protein B0H16DRAFT_1538702 [Mycena metata]|uniref:Uncharacterized protein n=1 Tax=Mycena metata TaxID=1033252 RepID=A0AAD7J7F2_9AGAR|nr:hypothetical protein B0H16DRAFT_1538702 [Mycena metata]
MEDENTSLRTDVDGLRAALEVSEANVAELESQIATLRAQVASSAQVDRDIAKFKADCRGDLVRISLPRCVESERCVESAPNIRTFSQNIAGARDVLTATQSRSEGDGAILCSASEGYLVDHRLECEGLSLIPPITTLEEYEPLTPEPEPLDALLLETRQMLELDLTNAEISETLIAQMSMQIVHLKEGVHSLRRAIVAKTHALTILQKLNDARVEALQKENAILAATLDEVKTKYKRVKHEKRMLRQESAASTTDVEEPCPTRGRNVNGIQSKSPSQSVPAAEDQLPTDSKPPRKRRKLQVPNSSRTPQNPGLDGLTLKEGN